SLGDRVNAIVIGGMAGVIDGRDELRFAGDGRLNEIWVYETGVRINVYKSHFSAEVECGVGSRGEGQRGRDDLIAGLETGGKVSGVDSGRAGVDGDGVFCAGVVR